jgi:hypothetical protein
LFEEAIILFDHDKTGISGTIAAYQMLSDFMPVQCWTEYIHPGKDPAICSKRELRKLFSSRRPKQLKASY